MSEIRQVTRQRLCAADSASVGLRRCYGASGGSHL